MLAKLVTGANRFVVASHVVVALVKHPSNRRGARMNTSVLAVCSCFFQDKKPLLRDAGCSAGTLSELLPQNDVNVHGLDLALAHPEGGGASSAEMSL